MNGNTVPLLLYLVNGLLAVLSILIGFIVRTHLKHDEDHRKSVDDEIQRLRQRLIDLGDRLMEMNGAGKK